MTGKLLTTTEVAEKLGIDRRSVWYRVNTGTLKPAFKHPGTGAYLFDSADIEPLAAKQGEK